MPTSSFFIGKNRPQILYGGIDYKLKTNKMEEWNEV